MTDEEIIKTLEACKAADCSMCPLVYSTFCKEEAMCYALNLIRRQRAERDTIVERMNNELKYDSGYPLCCMEDWVQECAMDEARKKSIQIVREVTQE